MIRLAYVLLLACAQLAVQAQDVQAQDPPEHPLAGTWKWQSTNPDGSVSHGFRWYWTDAVVGVHRIGHVTLDAETLKPTLGWSVFESTRKDGIGDRLWVDSQGRLGQATAKYKDQSSQVTFLGSSASGPVSGILETTWNEAKDTFREEARELVGFGPASRDTWPILEAHRIDYNPMEKGEMVSLGDERAILDPRFEDLHGKWESVDKEGHVNLSINFFPWDLGTSLIERFVFFDKDENPGGAGYNITRKDPVSGQWVIYSIGANGFSQIGGWDFIDGATTGQRQRENRLVRSFLSENEIHAWWQGKENGQYVDRGTGYILKRKKRDSSNSDSTEKAKKRSFYQRSQDANRFKGFIKIDFKVVEEKNIDSYLAAEKDWKSLHEQIMREGGLLHWHLAEIVGAKPGEPNYATVQVYASMEDLQNGSVWDRLDYSDVGGRQSLRDRTWPFVKSAGSDTYQAIDQYWAPDSGDLEIDRINMGYMTVKDGKAQAYVNAERTMAKPFWNVVSKLDPSFGGWAVHRLVESSRDQINHHYAAVHFKERASLPDRKTWQSNFQTASEMLNKPAVDWDSLRTMQGGPKFQIILKADSALHPVRQEWEKLKGSWKASNEDGSYRIKRVSYGTEQLELYDVEGKLTDTFIVPMRVEVRGGLNHFYAYHPNGTYHSIYKIENGKWYEQRRGIWRDGNGRPDAFIVYDRL